MAITPPRYTVLNEVAQERTKQNAKWGEQNHPNLHEESSRVLFVFASLANHYRTLNDLAAKDGTLEWTGILLEEVYEAISESDDNALRAELIQVAAVAVAWIEALDRRRS